MNHGKLYGLHSKPLENFCDIDFFYVTQTIIEALIPNPIVHPVTMDNKQLLSVAYSPFPVPHPNQYKGIISE
nr:hypothetical protein A5482_12025 [Cyanobacterium sp. IPPAS B-1200]